jgi:hypothetical protein
VDPAQDIEECRLAAPRRAEQDDELASVERRVHAAECVNINFCHTVDLGEIARLENDLRCHQVKTPPPMNSRRIDVGGTWSG